MRTRRGAAVVAGVLLAACVACSDPGGGDAASSGSTEGASAETDYLPGLGATVALPDGDPAAVVVLVPGGSWRTADPEGLLPLGEDLAAQGYAAVTITYGTDGTDAHFPRPLDDITCAMGFAAEQVPGVPVVVVGHSAGANLALLAGLHPDDADPTCPYAHVPAAGAVGLSGPYDVVAQGIGQYLFGVPQADDPELWADGDPFAWADARPDLPVLLVHGEADDLVPVSFTGRLGDALVDGGHDVRTELVPDAGHNDTIRSDVLLGTLTDWLSASVLGG